MSLAWLLAVGVAAAAPGPDFSLAAPAGWSETRLGPDDLGPGAWGVVYKSSPAARGAEDASITVVFYAAGNPHFTDAADYLSRQTEPLPVKVAGEETGPVTAAKLGPLPAKALWRRRPVGRPPEAVKRGAKLRAELTVAQGEGGFWVVTCAAPEERFERLRAAFDAARRSFAPKRPKGP